MLTGHDCDYEIATQGEQPFSILAYTVDDRWLVFGNETQSAALVLAVMFGFGWNETTGEA